MSESTRIDAAQTAPIRRKKRRLLPVVLLAMSVTGLIALGAIAAAYQFGGDLAAAPAASASPSVQLVDEKGMCVLWVPVAREAADLVVEFGQHPDGTKTDWAKMEQVARNLRTIRDIAPAERRTEIQTHVDALETLLEVRRTGANRTLNFEPMRAAGLSLAARCMAHAD